MLPSPYHIQHDLAWDQTRAAAVRSQRLINSEDTARGRYFMTMVMNAWVLEVKNSAKLLPTGHEQQMPVTQQLTTQQSHTIFGGIFLKITAPGQTAGRVIKSL